jgi:tRNA U34 5-methylaminomethyl-2-thiouridine-forming methyltransferase MnmC
MKDQDNVKNPEIVLTKDGSPTLLHPIYNEHYHSIHGALTESEHVYITSGLEYAANSFKDPLKVLEIGFGSGLNALLSGLFAKRNRRKIQYTGLEPFPISEIHAENIPLESLKTKDYPDLDPLLFKKLHHGAQFAFTSKEKVDFFEFEVLNITLQQHMISPERVTDFQVIFFDAFCPESQPELWTEEIFKSLSNSLVLGGNLVTYCAKGAVRRLLIAAGFKVEKLAGPLKGKREILRAVKTL